MSNIFKSNSRFSALVDDIPQQKNKEKKELSTNVENKEEKFNSFKSERSFKSESNFKGFNEKGRERYRLEREEEIKAQKEFDEREKERKKQESLKIENFPELVSISKNENKEDLKISYIETLKKEEDIIEKIIDKDLENLKPGWVLFKRNPLTRRTIVKNHIETDIIENKEKPENEIGIDIINALVELHNKRTDEYIKNYGYEEWEKMFKFPDWREREAYLEEMEEMANESSYSADEDEHEDEDDGL